MNETIIASLNASLSMLKSHIADLSDADLLTRPVAGANHPNWQIGHLISTELFILSKSGAALPESPAGFADRYTKQTASIDDPAAFVKKADLLAFFEKLHTATIGWVKTLTPAQLATASPEGIRHLAPTLADLLSLRSMHIAMHVGQIQVLRRKLGKPHIM